MVFYHGAHLTSVPRASDNRSGSSKHEKKVSLVLKNPLSLPGMQNCPYYAEMSQLQLHGFCVVAVLLLHTSGWEIAISFISLPESNVRAQERDYLRIFFPRRLFLAFGNNSEIKIFSKSKRSNSQIEKNSLRKTH